MHPTLGWYRDQRCKGHEFFLQETSNLTKDSDILKIKQKKKVAVISYKKCFNKDTCKMPWNNREKA